MTGSSKSMCIKSMWPLLYVLYTADVIPLVEMCQSRVHLYADDTQLYDCLLYTSDAADE